MTDRLAIGANGPPPHLAFDMHIADLFDAANGIATIETDKQEADVDDLLKQLRAARKDGDAIRAAEKKPHMDAAKAVDDQWREPLRKADIAADELKACLTPYRTAKQKAKDEAARKVREEADARQKAAQAALKSDDLEQRFNAETELEAAGKLAAVANKIDREATGLRTYWQAEVTDQRAALHHYIRTNPDAFRALIQQLADTDARSPATRRDIPGVAFTEHKRAA